MSEGQITSELFSEILDVLNERLGENKLNLSINIYGGTVMMISYDVRPATKDIDAIFETSPQIETILTDIAETYGLAEDWINQDIKEPLKYTKKENLKEIYIYNHLKIFAPSPEQMLAMKIMSSRAEPFRDFSDAEYLIEFLGLQKLEQVIDIFDRYFGRKFLRDRQKTFLNYVGKDLGKSWKEFTV